MKILINCSNLKVGGGLQVAHSFLNEIKNISTIDFIVVLSEKLAEQIEVDSFSNNFEFVKYTINPNVYKALFGRDKFLSSLELKNNVNAVFSVFGPTYWKPKAKHICGFAKPGYIYKDSPFFKRISIKEFLKLRLMEVFHMFDFKYNNDVLITENKNVSEILSQKINKEVYTVSNYYNQIFNENSKWDESVKIEDTPDVYKLLTISANYPHKNLAIIKSVVMVLRVRFPDLKFKFYLSMTNSDFGISKEDDLNQNIVFLGKVSINQCPYLYDQCDFLFLPTLLECFSASYCEAMFMEKPILTSDLSFARGICEDAAIYFDPVNADNIAEKIYILCTSEKLQKKLKKEGITQLEKFDSSKTRAEKYLKIIKS